MNSREQQGLAIAATCKITTRDGQWFVPSRSQNAKYTVSPDMANPRCTCPDFELTGRPCKHVYAARFVKQRELFETGDEQAAAPVPAESPLVSVKRTTYPQKWAAYDRAQYTEKAHFQVMLRDLCRDIPDPPANPQGGRPSVPMRDQIFAAIFKVYSTVSCRRFNTDLQEAKEAGLIGHAPSRSSIFRVFESPETFEILKAMVVRSAAPLKAIEENFACDSTGFSGCRYDRWFEEKWGTPTNRKLRAWVKCHIMCGVKTNVVTAVEIHGQNASDTVQLPALLATTANQFSVKELSADLAYSSHDNLISVMVTGAKPLIPFKKNATHGQGGLWSKMLAYFHIHRDEFLSRYHLRSNVESVFSAIKRKLGDSVRSKTDVAMKNEVLAKLVAHNIMVVNHEAHELGIDPGFGTESSVGPKLAAV
jgi:transposase